MNIKSKNNKIGFVVLVLSLLLTLSSCGRKETENYGQEISNHTVTKVETILKEPGRFDAKTVTVEGKIIRECPTGCWFDIKDQAAVIHIDTNPSGFAIPQKIGKTVTVEGKISVRNNQPTIIGTGVEIK